MQEIGKHKVILARLDTNDVTFAQEFATYREGYLNVLAHAYSPYFGDGYHMSRIAESNSILYFALAAGTVVGASYVKRNNRRGGTAVFPAEYRRIGLGKALVCASFADFPKQYSIVQASNQQMIALLSSVGFTRANAIEQVLHICGDDQDRLTDFSETPHGVLFNRISDRRTCVREDLTLLHRGFSLG